MHWSRSKFARGGSAGGRGAEARGGVTWETGHGGGGECAGL